MAEMTLLLVEDNKDDQAVAESTAKRYKQEHRRDIRLIKVATAEEAYQAINNEIDAAIIDLRLGTDPDAGGKIIESIKNKWRIPVAVFTGTPANIDNRNGLIQVYNKGETAYTAVFDRLLEIYDTGLTRIFGGRGVIEQEMDRVFWHAVLPSVQAWTNHQKDGRATERALLRFALSHLMEFLGEDVSYYFDEEVYIRPPTKKDAVPVWRQLRTGSIVAQLGDSTKYFLLLSPACDLAVHKEELKTDRILVCAIQDLNMHVGDKHQNLKKLCSNNYKLYLHFLPPSEGFAGGIVNFRYLEVFSPEEFDSKFSYPSFQISPMFIKDVVSRFSSYYARQGQPDLNFDYLVTRLTPSKPK